MNNIKNLLGIVPIFHCLFLITPILDASVLTVRVTVVQGFAGRIEEDEITLILSVTNWSCQLFHHTPLLQHTTHQTIFDHLKLHQLTVP